MMRVSFFLSSFGFSLTMMTTGSILSSIANEFNIKEGFLKLRQNIESLVRGQGGILGSRCRHMESKVRPSFTTSLVLI